MACYCPTYLSPHHRSFIHSFVSFGGALSFRNSHLCILVVILVVVLASTIFLPYKYNDVVCRLFVVVKVCAARDTTTSTYPYQHSNSTWRSPNQTRAFSHNKNNVCCAVVATIRVCAIIIPIQKRLKHT